MIAMLVSDVLHLTFLKVRLVEMIMCFPPLSGASQIQVSV